MALDVTGWVLGIALFLAGLYILGRAVLADRSRGRRRCPKCWYDMDAVSGLRCPECGKEARREAAMHRTRRHKKRAALGVLLLALGCLASIAPRLVRDPWGTLPTPVLSVVLWFYDDPSDTIFTNMTAALYAGKTTAFERLMLARYCARKLSDPNLGGAPIAGMSVPPSGGASPRALSMFRFGAQGQLLTVVEHLGREARPAIPAVIALSRDPANIAARDTLVALWPGTPELRARIVECLSETPNVMRGLLLSIERGPRPMNELIEPILASVERAENSTDMFGARALAALGPETTPALRRLIPHRSEAVRGVAIAELGERRDAEAVPGLTTALQDKSWRLRSSAIVALHKIGRESAAALPELCRLTLEEPRITVRMQALVALVPVGGDDPRVVQALAKALSDKAPEIRRNAASELAALGAAAISAEAALEAATHDPDESVALAAVAAAEAIKRRY